MGDLFSRFVTWLYPPTPIMYWDSQLFELSPLPPMSPLSPLSPMMLSPRQTIPPRVRRRPVCESPYRTFLRQQREES